MNQKNKMRVKTNIISEIFMRHEITNKVLYFKIYRSYRGTRASCFSEEEGYNRYAANRHKGVGGGGVVMCLHRWPSTLKTTTKKTTVFNSILAKATILMMEAKTRPSWLANRQCPLQVEDIHIKFLKSK